MNNLVVGAGLSGAVIANLIATQLGEKVTVIDQADHIAGNCFDYVDKETGIHVHKFGPHIFHTNHKIVWDYLSQFTDWHYYYFKPNTVVEGKKVTLPFNLNTIHQLFPKSLAEKFETKLIEKYGYNVKVPILELRNNSDKNLKMLAEYIYENIFKNYTIKQWGLKPEEIDSTVTARVPVVISRDDRYFQDKYQGIPKNGYTKMVENLLKHPLIKVVLNKDYKKMSAKKYNRTFYTGSIDEYFDYKYGQLPYRSLSFDIQVQNSEYYQNTSMTTYPNDFDYTRVIEHKYFLNEKSDKTVLSFEYPKPFQLGVNKRYYPIENEETQSLYNLYLKDAESLSNVYFLGRLGGYKYYNMDQIVLKAMELFFDKIKNSNN